MNAPLPDPRADGTLRSPRDRALPAYVVVTPVRDELRHIPHTLRTMQAQTHLPLRWVIVDDGSTDGTSEILAAATAGLSWITVIDTGSRARALGSAEVVAFQRGLETLPESLPWDFVVKLDGDVALAPDYFERLLARMDADPSWGIASGVYCEEDAQGHWAPVGMPAYHAAGASKVVRRACFRQIGGFVARKGWDTVDEIRAGLAGWRTGHFAELQFRHLKPEGAAMGSLATHRFHGEIYYETGGGAGFLLLKSMHRALTARPRLLGGAAMLWGYLASVLKGRERLVTDAEARFYRSLLRQRLAGSMSRRPRPASAPGPRPQHQEN
jgi:glycosyltransferase involved in cell wall biosynthesis